MKRYVFVKLGGSLITDKEKPYTVKEEILKELAQQIKFALEEDKELRLVIGNGAGSFAHYPAKQYTMQKGIVRSEQKMGFCMVQDAAARLNRIVVASLLKAGVKAMSLNPSSMMVASGNEIKNIFIEPLLGILNLGITPVIYGDIIYDAKQGSAIFSTERQLKELSIVLKKQGLKVEKIIHTGITRGVLDAESHVIPVISQENIAHVRQNFYQTKGFDVTGGMVHKVDESLLLAKQGITSQIINGVSEKDLLKKAILGVPVTGTIIN